MNYFQYRPKTFPRRTYISPSLNHNFQVDIIDLNKNGGGYILNCIDVFSRRAESVLLKGKSKASIKEGLNYMFNKFGAKPKLIQSDKEKGLYALEKELNDQGIKLYSVKNAYDYKNSAPIIERFNRTMRNYMEMILSLHPNYNMPTLVKYVIKHFPEKYNNTFHHTIKAKPNDIVSGKIKPEDVLREETEKAHIPKEEVKGIEEKFKIGDKVYIPIPPPVGIERKMAQKWYKEQFEIEDIIMTNPRRYKLKGKMEKYYYKQMKKA